MKAGPGKAVSLLQENGVDAFWVTKRENVRYLSGFTGSSGSLLITSSSGYFITDSRYATQSEREVPDYRVQVLNKGETMPERVSRLLKRRKTCRLGFEPGDLSFQIHSDLKKEMSGARLIPLKKGVESLRIVKSDKEVERILTAVRRAEQAFVAVRRRMRAGNRERDIALSMEAVMRRKGASRVAFDLIVASGERSALPHGIASDKSLRRAELVIVDFGAECDGYFSDMTRTLYLGKRLCGRKRTIYDTVLEAQEAAIEAVKPGLILGDIDGIARKTIQKAGYGEYFGHGTGHGIGLEVHEVPYVAPKSETPIREGMVFTVEPGIYVPGLGGVRIEDMVLVTEKGCRVLTRLSKDWQI